MNKSADARAIGAGMTYIYILQVIPTTSRYERRAMFRASLCPEVFWYLPVSKPEDIV